MNDIVEFIEANCTNKKTKEDQSTNTAQVEYVVQPVIEVKPKKATQVIDSKSEEVAAAMEIINSRCRKN